MTIAIHAGLKKCGSSSLHAFLRSNRDVLREHGIHYPGPGRPGTDVANQIRSRKRFAPSTDVLSELADYWAKIQSGTLVLSSEMLEPAAEQEIARVKETFTAKGCRDDFMIVFIVRDLSDLIPSVYSQKVRMGANSQDFDTFFELILEEDRVDYFITVLRWANVFGCENIRVRLLNSDFIDDFLHVLGVEPGDSLPTMLSRPQTFNESPGWRVVEALRALLSDSHGLPADHPLPARARERSKFPLLAKHAMAVGQNQKWEPDRGNYLTSAQAERCADLYAETIRQLNDRLQQSLPAPARSGSRRFRERDFMPDASHIPADELRAFYDDLWLALPRKAFEREA